ncbi:hypothetical protein BHE74_00013315, partial [Ensete ventricosum]
VAASLSSNDCFLLQSGSSLFAWHGNSSTSQQQQWAARIAEFLKAQGNSFQKKLSLLFGAVMHASEVNFNKFVLEETLAALSSAFNPSSSSLPQSNYKSNNVNHDGPTQRASALAALSSAFNPTSSTKTSAPKPLGPRQGSQRAAAVAALSSVLTAERKKGDSDTSAARSSRSPSPGPRAAVTGTIS